MGVLCGFCCKRHRRGIRADEREKSCRPLKLNGKNSFGTIGGIIIPKMLFLILKPMPCYLSMCSVFSSQKQGDSIYFRWTQSLEAGHLEGDDVKVQSLQLKVDDIFLARVAHLLHIF